jgi:hypothetical protein
VAQLGARLDGIEEVEGSNPFGSTSLRTRQRVKAAAPESDAADEGGRRLRELRLGGQVPTFIAGKSFSSLFTFWCT